MKADASLQLYLDRGDETPVRPNRWTAPDGTDHAMVSIGILTIYAASPEQIVAKLRTLADDIEALEFHDDRTPVAGGVS